jgi:hypothetical protein
MWGCSKSSIPFLMEETLYSSFLRAGGEGQAETAFPVFPEDAKSGWPIPNFTRPESRRPGREEAAHLSC